MAPPSAITYKDLQALIDKIIAKHGTEDAYHLIDSAVKTELAPYGRDMAMAHYIINICIEDFGTTHKHVFHNTATDKRARWSAFYFIKKHTRLTYKDIAWRFELTNIGPVQYGETKIIELLSQPKIDKVHHECHVSAAGKIERFIKKTGHGR